jgi:RyR domain
VAVNNGKLVRICNAVFCSAGKAAARQDKRNRGAPTMITKNALIEKLAELEHQQWMSWVKAVGNDVTPQRQAKWAPLMIPYSELSEASKEQDREWARKVLEIISATGHD